MCYMLVKDQDLLKNKKQKDYQVVQALKHH